MMARGMGERNRGTGCVMDPCRMYMQVRYVQVRADRSGFFGVMGDRWRLGALLLWIGSW